MQRLRQSWGLRAVTLALYALAMLLVGFAHTFSPSARAAGPDLSSYALPDGTVPLLCQTTGDEELPASHEHGGDCAACRLSTAPGLLPVPSFVALPPSSVSVVESKKNRALRPTLMWAGHHARGPPTHRPV
jgi:hypothetical protein